MEVKEELESFNRLQTIYAWSAKMAKPILKRHSQELKLLGWPSEAEEFFGRFIVDGNDSLENTSLSNVLEELGIKRQ